MTPAEVLRVFPEEQRYEDWMGGNRNDALPYHGLIFGFNECNAAGPIERSRLVEVTIFGREDARLWGQRMSDWSRVSVTEYLERNNIRFELQESGNVLVRSLSLSLSFSELDGLEYVEAWCAEDRR